MVYAIIAIAVILGFIIGPMYTKKFHPVRYVLGFFNFLASIFWIN